jgi:putative PEP-CTERM system histidine kinase
LVLLRGEGDRLVPGEGWNWPHVPQGSGEGCAELIALLETSGHVVEFAQASRMGVASPNGGRVPLPPVLLGLEGAWAGIPLIHCGRLQGLAVIAHPPLRRALDWEDFDLFRAAGRQAASYLAEARSVEALAEARRFDEFNRRFAFILHDVKNLVSQLSLVARNAERHADNPEFRADMVATLQSSVKKMNDLLARLAPGAKAKSGVNSRAIGVQTALAAVAGAKKRSHKVELSGDARLAALADPAALEQAVSHIVQNAIDASPADAPVAIRFGAVGNEVRIEIEDQGCGMSADFVAGRLFLPFASTKEGGFGIGAHEARALVEAMGGRLEVRSRPGAGSCFTISLQRAEPISLAKSERISA